MKRRDFLCSAGAAATLPVLPLPAAAVPVAAAPVHASQVGWAALFARVNTRTTPALLQKWMGVGPEQAHALMSELIQRNIIHAPVAGSAAAIQPMHPQGSIPGTIKTTGQVLRKARDTVEALLDDQDIVEDEISPEESTDETA